MRSPLRLDLTCPRAIRVPFVHYGIVTNLRACPLVPRGSTVDGFDAVRQPVEVKRRIGALPDSHGIYPRLTARENIRYFGRLHGLSRDTLRRRLDELFAALGMDEFRDRRCDKLSTGMKQKVSIARTLIHDPPVMIFDEPTHGLDVLVARAVDSSGQAVGVAEGEWWRLITAPFLHYGILHLGMNMLVLWFIGPALEYYFGHWRYALVYLVSGLAGSAGALIWSPNALTVGASGAIWGLMGAAVVLEARRIYVFGGQAMGLIVFNLIFTLLVPGVSIGGHIGGAIGGAVVDGVRVPFGDGLVPDADEVAVLDIGDLGVSSEELVQRDDDLGHQREVPSAKTMVSASQDIFSFSKGVLARRTSLLMNGL